MLLLCSFYRWENWDSERLSCPKCITNKKDLNLGPSLSKAGAPFIIPCCFWHGLLLILGQKYDTPKLIYPHAGLVEAFFLDQGRTSPVLVQTKPLMPETLVSEEAGRQNKSPIYHLLLSPKSPTLGLLLLLERASDGGHLMLVILAM